MTRTYTNHLTSGRARPDAPRNVCRVCFAPLAENRADAGWLCDRCLSPEPEEPVRDLTRRSVRPIR
jgi:hypothetical protein